MENKELENKEVETVEITGYTHEGQGVARISDMVVFVKGALVGEKVIIEIMERKKSYARAIIREILVPSPHRVPVNPAETGGCNLAHASYAHQLEIKNQIVANALRAIPGVTSETLAPIIPSEQPIRYRNKGHFQVQRRGLDKIHFGFYEEGTHNFSPGESSILYSEKVNQALQKLAALLKEEKITVYDRRSQKGTLRYIMIRESFSTGEMMLVMVTAETRKLNKSLISKIHRTIPEFTSIYQNINLTRGHEILGKSTMHLRGEESITDKIGKYTYNLFPGTFFQVNTVQTEKLYAKVLEFLEPKPEDLVVDAYGGIGTIGMYIAGSVRQVISVDSYKDAEKEGKISAEKNGITNLEFRTGKVEEILPEMEEEIQALIIDPPRAGCKKEVLESIVEKRIPRIIYVSCNPSTLARDLAILTEGGAYQVEQIQPYDQFSQTSHVETVTLITRVKE